MKKDAESEKEGDSAEQDFETNTDNQNEQPHLRAKDQEMTEEKPESEKTTSMATGNKDAGGKDSKLENAGEGHEAEPESKAEPMNAVSHHSTAEKCPSKGCDDEEASSNTVRNTNEGTAEPIFKRSSQGMNKAPQFSDVAKQIMKEVQETRDRRNKCLRDLRSMKPKAARIYMVRRYKEKKVTEEKEASNTATLGEDISGGVKSDTTVKSLSSIPEATSHSSPQASKASQKHSNKINSPSKKNMEAETSVQSVENHEVLEQSKELQHSPDQEQTAAPVKDRPNELHEDLECNGKPTNSSPGPEIKTLTQLSVECSASSSPESPEEGRPPPSSTTEGERKQQTGKNEKQAAILPDVTEVTRRPLAPLLSERHLPPDGGKVNSCTVEGSEPRQPDSDDTLSKKSVETKAEPTEGRADQCLVAAGRARVCCVSSTITTTTAASITTTAAAAAATAATVALSRFAHPVAGAAPDKVTEKAKATKDVVDSNGNFEAGKAEDERPLKETGNIQPKVVEVKHKSGVEPRVELLPLCNSPRSAGATCAANSPTAPKQDKATREQAQDLKETQTPRIKSEVHTSVAAQRRAVNLEILQNAEKARREKVGIFLKVDDCAQRVSKVDTEKTTRSMKQDGTKVTTSVNTRFTSENGIEGDALEGPWATPQLARVVQELVVSRKFNMSSAQAKKRQQNLTQLDASQKDRTLIFDSSRLIKTKHGSERSENLPQPENEADQRHKVGSKNASKITGRRNGRGGASGDEPTQVSPADKKKQLQRQAASSTEMQSEPASVAEDGKDGDRDCLESHDHPQSSTRMTASEEPTQAECVQTDGTSVNTVNVIEEYNRCEVGRAKLIDNDNCGKMQSSLKIEKLSRSPKQTRTRLHKVVENLSLKHSQVSPKSSPPPTSPGFSSSCNSSPISAKDSPKSSPVVSPSFISSQTRTSKSVAQSPRVRETPSSSEIKVTGQHVATETASPVGTPRQSSEGKENCLVGESVIKSKECEIPSPLRKTPSRSDPPTELIFNFVKLPQILTDHCNANKKDQHSIADESDLQMESRGGHTRSKERQKTELQLPRASKSSTGKLDSDILQFFESQQQKPREILRNETVIQEHFKDSNSISKLKSDSGRKLDQDAKKTSASTPQSKGCSHDNIEPGRRDRTSSDPMDRVTHENIAGKLRAVKSFDETSAIKSSSEEDEKPQKMKSVEGTAKHVTSKSHEGKQVEQGGESKAGEKNFSISTVTNTSSKTDAARQTIHTVQGEPEEEEQGDKGKIPASVHSQESTNQRVVITRNASQENTRRITKTNLTRITGKENNERLLDSAKNPEPSETGQADVDSEVTPQSTTVAPKKKNTLKDRKLSKVQMDESQGMKNQEGVESESLVNNAVSGSERGEITDRMLTNSGDTNLFQDCLSTVSNERPEDEAAVSQDNGGTLFVAVGQELKENTKEAGMQKAQIGCEEKLPLQDDRADGVANSLFNRSLVLQAAHPPLPQLPPVSYADHAPHSGSSPTKPDSKVGERKLDTKATGRVVPLQDEQHQQGVSEDSKDTLNKVVCPVTKNPDRKEVMKKQTRDSVTFHLTLVATGSCKKERDADQTPPETSQDNVLIKKKNGTFLETCVDDDPQQHERKGSQSTIHSAPGDTIKAAYNEEEKTEDTVYTERLMETNKTVSTGRGGAMEASGRGTAARRLPRSHRRLTKTISEGSFTLGQQQEPDVSDPPHQNPEKLPRPPSLLRSRTESEFSPDRLAASATAVECVAAARTSTVSEIFARGVYGRLKAKSRSVENIRLSSLCCVEIPFPADAPAPPVPAPRSSVFTASSSSSCRIVGVLKKKHSADSILDSKSSPKVDFRSPGGFRGTAIKPKAEFLPVGELERAKSEHPMHDTACSQDRSLVLVSSSEAPQDTTARQVFREKQGKLVNNTSDQEKIQKISPSEGAVGETPIYQNIPEALLCQKKAEAVMAEGSLNIQVMEEPQQKSAAGDQRKPAQKFIHIYENVPIIAGREPQDEAMVLESPKRIVQQTTEKPTGGNEFTDSPSSSSWSSTSPLGDVFFPSKRTTFEKTSLKRKQQPESESRIEKQKSNYMKQRTVRVGILKKQKSDITGVRLQKLHYFDTELPGELRRSYSVSGGGVQSKGQGSPKNGAEDGTDPEGPSTDAKQKEDREELIDLERRCHSSISGGSNTSRSSAIDRILQTCAPCISSNTTSSTLDLSSSPISRPKPTQKKSGFYCGGDTMGGGGGRSSRRQHTRTKHPYKSSYSSSDVTLLTSGASSLASQDTLTDRQSTKAAPEDCMEALDCAKSEDQTSKTAEAAESGQSNGSQDTGSTSGLASSEYSSSNGEATNANKHIISDSSLGNFERKSSTPTPTEQIGGVNSDTDFYSELLDTILSVVDGQEQSFSGEIENLCSSEGAASQPSEEQKSQSHDDSNKTNKTSDRPAAASDSDSTTSVDSELAEVRRRITERFPPTPRSDPEASQESVLASPSAVCPMPDCAACRSTNLSEPLMFAFDQPITPPAQCEPGRAASLPFVDHTFTSTGSNDHFTRSSSLPHDSDIYHSTQVMCRHDQDEEEYWSAGEDTARGTPQSTPRHQSSYQGHLPQHLKQQCSSNPVSLHVLSSPEDSLTKDSVLQDSSPHDSSPLTDSGVEILKDHSELSSNQLVEEVSQLRLENEKLTIRNRGLQSEVEELRRVKESIVEEDQHLKPKISEMTVELTHAKEALSALKADRKRLKAEKFDLLNQMKQLYATLEDKEKELRDFIRNYEQRMKDSDESLRHLAAERDETEREKWNILKHARDESEKVVKLSAQLGLKEATVKKLQEELDMVRKQLNSVGYYSDAESVRTNGLPTPTASTPTCSPLPVATPTPTPNGRGSSADSGVRVSSDRESTASHDGGPDTPKESPSLSPLYATPAYIRAGDDQPGGGDKTPTSVQTPATMSGLANSSANAGGLSRSAEQLCERLSEAGEISKAQGTSTLMRKNHKSGGTWGSISRVFARQKKRAALDTSIYDGSGSDKRASWSPSSSLCASPLTEESYSEKLRLLEEAQHIPLERWKAPTVLAWLEVTLGMAQYGAMCAENIRSGKVLLELSDSELEAGLGITHPMHRKKLRLAIEELREPRLTRYPRISALGHTWVSSEWLPDLGLPHYSDSFANSLVDGRLLDALTKKELEKHLGVHRKFHQASIIHGVHLLRIVRFDRQVLAERRRQCELVDTDPVVWTNLRWVRWARSIDLAEYADNLKDSGVHGALVVLEPSFTADTMSTALGIPQSKNIIRRHLATELESLVNPARQQLDEQARYAKMERRRQEKLASGGSLGRSFSRSYGTGLEKGDKDKRRASLRGSLSRALGLRLREEAASGGSTNGGGESSSSGGQSPAVTTRAHPRHGHHARPRSSIMPSQAYFHHETHRRVKSIGDIETITVTPV